MIHEYIVGICVWFEVGFLGGGFRVGFPFFFLLTASLDLFLHWYEFFYGLSQLLWASSYKYIPHSFPPIPPLFSSLGFTQRGSKGGVVHAETPPPNLRTGWLAGQAIPRQKMNPLDDEIKKEGGCVTQPIHQTNSWQGKKEKGGGQWGNKVAKKFGKIRR